MNDRVEFAKMMTAAAELFERGVTEQLAEMYWSILKPYSDQEVKRAFSKVLQGCRFFPKPVDLIEAIEGSKDDRIAQAVATLKSACESVGAYSSVIIEDPGLLAVIDHWGGWVEVCHLPIEEWNYRQKQFRDLYRAHMNTPREQKKLIGITESENRERFSGELLAENTEIPTLVGEFKAIGQLTGKETEHE